MMNIFLNDIDIFSSVLPTLVEIIEPDLDIRESHLETFECLIKETNPEPKIIWLKEGVAYSQGLAERTMVKSCPAEQRYQVFWDTGKAV